MDAMKQASLTARDHDELSEEDLEVVIGGLERAWRGTWDAAELGPAPAVSDGAARIDVSSAALRDP